MTPFAKLEATTAIAPAPAEIAEEARRGLTDEPKWLSAKLFYDAEGSRLFEEITRLPEYYLTRTEQHILTLYAEEMMRAAGGGDALSIVELGAGSAAKTTTILSAAAAVQSRVDYYPIDVSHAALEHASERLRNEVPHVRVHPLHVDYDHGVSELRRIRGRKLVLFIGSSIGNFEPLEGARMLANLRRNLNPGDAVLLGTDMRKRRDLLLPAYDDAAGVTAAFNKNILARLNRELDADFDLDLFRHRAIWNAELSRMEMHLQSVRAQRVTVGALELELEFALGETIHTENSYKFTARMIDSMCETSRLRRERTWSDERRWFTVHLLRV